MKTNAFFPGCLAALVLFLAPGCGSETDPERQATEPELVSVSLPLDTFQRDLPEIRAGGTLKAITAYSATTYFHHRNHEMGFEYELLRSLTKDLGLDLEIVLANDPDEMKERLLRGEGDLIAFMLPIEEDPNSPFIFSDYHITTREVLVQRKPDGWRDMTETQLKDSLITNLDELSGKTIYTQEDQYLDDYLREHLHGIGLDVRIQPVPEHLTEEDLMMKIVERELDNVVAKELTAHLDASYYPMLEASLTLTTFRHLGWAMRRSSPELKKKVDAWLEKTRPTGRLKKLYEKYFQEPQAVAITELNDRYIQRTGSLSPYDPIIVRHASDANLDWRLVAAQIYQESQFDPDVVSWAGAAGLMQLMPQTAEAYGVSDPTDPEESIRAGVQMVHDLLRSWHRKVPNPAERIKFVLASYNTGIGHVQDAQRLARKYGADHQQWDQVASYLLKKSKPQFYQDPVVQYGYCRGIEPVNYVKLILRRFRQYQQILPDKES